MNGAFRINMYRNSPISTDQTTDQTNQTTNQTDQMNVIKNKKENLSEAEKQLVAMLRKKSDYNQKELAKELGWTTSKVKYYMTRLVERGILIRKGTNRKGSWMIEDK